jgi:hypothetical protein
MLITVMFHSWNRIYTIKTCYFGYNMWFLKTFTPVSLLSVQATRSETSTAEIYTCKSIQFIGWWHSSPDVHFSVDCWAVSLGGSIGMSRVTVIIIVTCNLCHQQIRNIIHSLRSLKNGLQIEEPCPVGYNPVFSVESQPALRKVMSPSLGLKSKPRKKPVQSYACCLLHVGFLVGIPFIPEDGGDKKKLRGV